MNALELLKSDHQTVEKLFQAAESGDPATRKSTFDKIKFELEAHAHIEESIFYPAIQETGDEDIVELTAEALQEHVQAKTALGSIAVSKDDPDAFDAMLTKLIEDVRHHVEEEENEMFPAVKELFDDESLEALGDHMQAEKESFETSTESAYN